MIASNRNKTHAIVPAVAALLIAPLLIATGAPAFAASPNDELTAGVKTLSMAELQSQVSSQGITVTEMKVDGLILEVEGYDAEGREIELKLDRRTGETLSKKFDD